MNQQFTGTQARHYRQIAGAIEYIREHQSEQPSLEQVAHAIALSPSHTQRLFQQWAGLSPKAFLRFLTKEKALQQLMTNATAENATLHSGLSSSGRLHDLILHWEAMTAGNVRNRGQGLTIQHGWHDTLYGSTFIAITVHGLCYLAFEHEGVCPTTELKGRWPQAKLIESPESTLPIAKNLFTASAELRLHIIGSPFQHKVWEALLRIPIGEVSSYSDIAQTIREPKSARAVGHAISQNPIGKLIPCHRVIRKNGDFGNYHWGDTRKIAMLLKEQQEKTSSHKTGNKKGA